MKQIPSNVPNLSSPEIIELRPAAVRPQPSEAAADAKPLNVFSEVESAYIRPGFDSLQHVLVDTIMLLGRECPFRCLMCDLWKYTHTQTTKTGAIYRQVDWALRQFKQTTDPTSQHWIKLYNASNFFDNRSVPQEDRDCLPALLQHYSRVIVENHPKLCFKDDVRAFANNLSGTLEVALGLETIHPEVLPRLNKQMTEDDFSSACAHLLSVGATIRAFVLLKPPGLDDSAGLDWALRTIDFAIQQGVSHVSIIPTRAGNGAMEMLMEQGHFSPPSAHTLERCLAEAIRLAEHKAIVTADLWDWEQLEGLCSKCSTIRREHTECLNKNQSTDATNYTATAALMCGCGS